jgi:hypothetical protein
MIWLASPYWLNLIDIELVDLLHMILDVVCKSVYGARIWMECCLSMLPSVSLHGGFITFRAVIK